MASDHFVQLSGNSAVGHDFFVGIPGNAGKADTRRTGKAIKVPTNKPGERITAMRGIFT